MKTFGNKTHAVLLGKASDVFKEIALLAKWEKYGIGYRVYSLAIFNLN